MRTLYLVRHANFDVDAEPADGLEGSLTALGRRQARWTARRLAKFPIGALYYSDLRRAAETAQIIAEALPGVPVRAARVLRECMPAVSADMAEYFADVPADEMAAGTAQAEAAFARFFKPSRAERHEVLVAHGNLIRYLVLRALDAPGELWMHMDIYQCGISIVQIAPDGQTQLIAHNDTGHIPPRWLTYV
jgi:broad specificity phosphatase PhoE